MKDDGDSSVINLEWEKMNKTVGDTILLSCVGESAGMNNSTGAWLSTSQVMETIRVPGNNSNEESTTEEANTGNKNATEEANTSNKNATEKHQ